jgi:hypothetical protein
VDLYFESYDTLLSISPSSSGDNLVVTRLFLGGVYPNQGIPWQPQFQPHTNAQDRLNKVAVLNEDLGGGSAKIFGTRKTFLLHEWFTLTIRVGIDESDSSSLGLKVFMEDSETLADFGPGPVEIFPAGPYGVAFTETGVVATPGERLNDSADVVRFLSGLEAPFGALPAQERTRIYIDNISVRGVGGVTSGDALNR